MIDDLISGFLLNNKQQRTLIDLIASPSKLTPQIVTPLGNSTILLPPILKIGLECQHFFKLLEFHLYKIKSLKLFTHSLYPTRLHLKYQFII